MVRLLRAGTLEGNNKVPERRLLMAATIIMSDE